MIKNLFNEKVRDEFPKCFFREAKFRGPIELSALTENDDDLDRVLAYDQSDSDTIKYINKSTLIGPTGEVGPTGLQGDIGPTGEQGPTGQGIENIGYASVVPTGAGNYQLPSAGNIIFNNVELISQGVEVVGASNDEIEVLPNFQGNYFISFMINATSVSSSNDFRFELQHFDGASTTSICRSFLSTSGGGASDCASFSIIKTLSAGDRLSLLSVRLSGAGGLEILEPTDCIISLHKIPE